MIPTPTVKTGNQAKSETKSDRHKNQEIIDRLITRPTPKPIMTNTTYEPAHIHDDEIPGDQLYDGYNNIEPDDDQYYEDPLDMSVPSYILFMAGVDSYVRQNLRELIGMGYADIPFIGKESIINAMKNLRKNYRIQMPESRVITIWIAIQMVQQAMSQDGIYPRDNNSGQYEKVP